MKKIFVSIASVLFIGVLVVITLIPKPELYAQETGYYIGGYVNTPWGQARSAKVYLYDVESGGSPIDSTCMNNNHWYTFDGLEDGIYYLDVSCAIPGNDRPAPYSRVKLPDRIEVEIDGDNVEQDLYLSTNAGGYCNTGCPTY